MVLAGSLVSPAVMAMDSVPPSTKGQNNKAVAVIVVLQANAAVTNTDAKPPIPPTKGASPMNQLWPPI